MRLKYILTVLFFIQGIFSFATAQIPDYLVHNGITYALHVNPMEEYFSEYPERRPQSAWRSSALWRGYVAIFEIIDNELFVVDIQVQSVLSTQLELETGKFNTEWVNVTAECLNGENRKKVSWFNGLLVLPHGELINYVHMGYQSTYEYYKIIEIENGNYINEYDLNYKEHKSPEYTRYIYHNNSAEESSSSLWIWVLVISGMILLITCIVLLVIKTRLLKF